MHSELKKSLYKKAEQEIVEDVVKHLNEALELMEQGKEAEGNAVIDNLIEDLEIKIQEIENKSVKKHDRKVDYSKFPKTGEILVEGDKVKLSVIKQDEREKYLSISYEYGILKKMYEDEGFRDITWREFTDDNAFVCSIYDKYSGEFVGYCSIKDLTKKYWELAIELKPEKCHKGYGSEALKVFMNEVHRRTGNRFFRTRVEIDNHASQGLMKKLEATPNGISEYLLHGDDIEKFQIEHRDKITEEIREVAEEFCMDAEDILGYVLEYLFDMKE